ncbi:MAG: cadherin-like beta sandwich domain-containing protein [Clostridiaceae bacterium]|nr:cadherin-like beta sandwich domain-containing protein [Clostridiaceae bacterium]
MNRGKLFSYASLFLALLVVVSVIPIASVRAAASPSISVGGTAEVGKTIAVSIKISGTDGPYSGFSGQIIYNSNMLRLDSISSNYSAYNWYTSLALGTFGCAGASITTGSTIVTAQFTCLEAGTTQISLHDFEVDANYSSASASVTIKTPVPLSGNANLSSLKVSPGSLSPGFSSSRTSYSMEVGEDVSKVTVTAVAEHSKAKVTLNGVQNNIKPGVNTIKITVKAEDGTTKVYSIKVTRATGPTGTPTPTPQPLPLMEYLGQELMIIPIDEDTTTPEGFTPSTSTYKGVEIPVFMGPSFAGSSDRILLVQLLFESDIKLFVYDPKTQTVHPFLFISQPDVIFRILAVADTALIPFGYEPFDYEYDGERIIAYRLISDPDHPQILLNLMNDSGQASFFFYDTENKMMLPYRGETVLVEPTSTPTPSPAPTDPTQGSLSSESTVPSETIVATPEKESLVRQLMDIRNPLTLLFYLVSLLAVVLVAGVIALAINRRSDLNDEYYEEEYLPDEPIPPIAVMPKGSRQAYSGDDVFLDEDSFSSDYKKTTDEYIPSIVRTGAPEKSRGPVEPEYFAKPPHPVADSVSRMGVRTVNANLLPGLSNHPENDQPKTNPSPVVSAETPEHIPVRLKQELVEESKKANTNAKSGIDTVLKSNEEKQTADPKQEERKTQSAVENQKDKSDAVPDFPDISTRRVSDLPPSKLPKAEPDPDPDLG